MATILFYKKYLKLSIFNIKCNRSGFQHRHHHQQQQTYFDKILIANRGEIACRIIRTARKLGIKTVAIYSTPDSKSKHVKFSDEAVCVGPAAAKDSYLNMENILHAIKQTGSQAVHPGYGFLSENSQFVQLLEQENITFIGPSSDVMKKMGDKLESKRLAIAAGVNTIPGYDAIITDADQCASIAKDIGYPVMIKATAGGGGKGMRIAWKEKDVKEGFKLSTQEAISSFGDGRILLEKFIAKPRHIEIQVLGDKYGNVIHLGERECSIQRRNQKIIEEAPSSFLDEETRYKMGKQAIMLCKNLGYSSAGTVEFLMDENKNFYFLEMNTRLQVEHGVTEAITGIDLVEQMIHVAAGHKLNFNQNDIQFNGWAIESRIYAEDPFKNFGLPSIGKLFKYIEPSYSTSVRCDSGTDEGSDISVYYDPMISKLICHGNNRSEAIQNSLKSLDAYVIRGVSHNIPLLRDILSEEKFQNGDLNTNYLNDTYPNGFKGYTLKQFEKEQLISFASVLYAITNIRNNENIIKVYNKNKNEWKLSTTIGSEKFIIYVKLLDKSFQINLNNSVFNIEGDINFAKPLIEVQINNKYCMFQLLSKNPSGDFEIIFNGNVFKINVIPEEIAKFEAYMNNKPKTEFSKLIKSPMPGLIKSVNCKEGDFVEEGQEICIIEAMKMQNCIFATIEGKIKKLNIKEGDVVGDNDILIEYENVL